MKKLTMTAFGLSLMLGSAFAAPPQAASSTPATKTKAKKQSKKKTVALTSATTPKPVAVKQ